jgi:hypothetical protein
MALCIIAITIHTIMMSLLLWVNNRMNTIYSLGIPIVVTIRAIIQGEEKIIKVFWMSMSSYCAHHDISWNALKTI